MARAHALGVPDEAAALRAANARLREEGEAKDTEIAALRTSHQAQLNALRAQVAALFEEVADLRARLGQNSRNSSRPPSSEGPAKPVPRSLRKKTGPRPAGMTGFRCRPLSPAFKIDMSLT